MPYSALSDDISTSSQFTRRKNITITTGGTSTPVNYQVKLTISYEPEMQADFNDIRFNTKTGTYIDYWIETYTTSTVATVWIELPGAIANPGSDIILMYYGNPGLSDGGDVGNTMVFGDDFNDASLDTSKWTKTEVGAATISESGGVLTAYSGIELGNHSYVLSDVNISTGTIIEVNAALPSNNGSYEEAGIGAWYLSVSDDSIIFLDASVVNINWYLNSRKDGGNGTATQVAGDDSYHDFKIIWESTQIRWYIDNVLKKTESNSLYIPLDATPFGFGSQFGSGVGGDEGYGYLNIIFVRKYIANEPTASYGTTQHQRIIPQFIG